MLSFVPVALLVCFRDTRNKSLLFYSNARTQSNSDIFLGFSWNSKKSQEEISSQYCSYFTSPFMWLKWAVLSISGLCPYTEDHVIHTKYKDSVSRHHTNFVFRHAMKLVKVPCLKNMFSLLPNLFQLPWKVKGLLTLVWEGEEMGSWFWSCLVIGVFRMLSLFPSAGRDHKGILLSYNCLKPEVRYLWFMCSLTSWVLHLESLLTRSYQTITVIWGEILPSIFRILLRIAAFLLPSFLHVMHTCSHQILLAFSWLRPKLAIETHVNW